MGMGGKKCCGGSRMRLPASIRPTRLVINDEKDKRSS
jgi:hypothetical protein